MKKLFILVLFIFFMCNTACYAAKYNILVLPNNLLLQKNNNLVYQQSATLISTDIINYYNQLSDTSAIQINQLKTYLNKPENYRFKKEVQQMLNDYKTNYVLDFATIQKLASRFGAKQVLLVSCNMDAQSYVLRRTLWDALDIPGATVVDPAYRLTTEVNLIDSNNQIVLWQHNYQKLISSRESRMITPVFGDTNEQLEKIKKYSIKFLAPQIVQETQLALYNMSPYQNLNVHTEIVKPNYVSIDKIKVDSKRGGVKSARFAKRTSISAGRSIKSGTKKLFKKSNKNNLAVEEQIKQIKDEQTAKLELQKQKQQLKYEKQLSKTQLKAAKKQAQTELKMQLEQEKQKLLQGNQNIEQEPKQEIKEKKIVKEKEKINKQQEKELDIKYSITPETPSERIFQPNNKQVPYIRTNTNLREKNYTINDY